MIQPASPTNQKNEKKYYSLNTSEGEKYDKSLSVKKKLFTRKPAVQYSKTEEKKMRATERFAQSTVTDNSFVEVTPFMTEPPVKVNFVKRKERQTEFYIKQRDQQNSPRGKKDTSFSPFTSTKNNSIENISYFSRKPSAKQCQTISINESFNDQVCLTAPSFSRTRLVEKKDLRTQNEQNHQLADMSQKRKFDINFTSTQALTPVYSKTARLNVISKNVAKIQKPKPENFTFIQCIYCRNNKEMTDIMCEKYSKLQDQLRAKNDKIKELTNKYESLKEQHSKLNEKYEHKMESAQLKEIQFFRERQELINRIDGFKADLTRLSQKQKYAEIQNSILLRFKDEYQLMTKEYDLIVYENQKLQKSINQIRRGDKQDFSKKNKIENNIPNYVHPHIIPKHANNANNQKFNIQDDLMSLSLSQRSFEQF